LRALEGNAGQRRTPKRREQTLFLVPALGPHGAHTVAMPDQSGRSNTQAVVVVVAVVGLLASVGSAALGGFWANRSVEREFKSQRSAEIQDLRRDIYAAYLRSTAQWCTAVASPEDVKQAQKAQVELLDEQARVLLVGGTALRTAVNEFTDGITTNKEICLGDDITPYDRLRTAFINGAKPDLKSP
jgi:hypothetical protein